jgi:subtilisin family serine protease
MALKTKITVAVLVTILLVVSTSYADIWADPTSFNVSTPEGCRVTETLTIGNNGVEALNFMIRTRQVGTSGKNTILSSEPAQRDFTQIAPNASYQPGRLIVRFAQSSSGQMAAMERRNQILSSMGGASIEREFQIVPGLCVVDLPAGMTVEEALQEFNSSTGVLYAEPDYRVSIDSTIPNDTFFSELWGMHNTGQSGGTVDADIDAPEAWDISTGSSDIIVAVIDTGVDYTHPDLAGNMWVNTGEIPGNGQDDDGNGYIDDVYGYDFCNYDGDPMDDHYHGTHCAGTIGAVGNNSQGVAGVCWHVRIMALKFLDSGGSGWTSDAINCVNYSRIMGANLSSNSWGGGGYSQGLKDAIDAAGAAGMLFVAAAGNDGGNNDSYPHYPSSYDSESLIAVMATDRYDNKSSFSNYGPVSVDLGAPGSSILSCQPGNQYQYLSGTSMATPHVAGACALLWSMNPAEGNVEVKNILIETVDPTLSGQCVSGGRLNLYNAILEIKAPWIIIEPEEGTVGAGGSTDVDVTFDALELTPGIYEAEIVIISDAPSSPTIIPVTLTVTADDLQVAPVANFESSGVRWGPFTPRCMTYMLTNNGTAPVSWTTSETEDWLSVEPYEGTLGPSDSIGVDVCITSDANLLTPNIYEQILTFENLNSGSIKHRTVTLTVKPPDCFTESFDDGDNDLEGLMLTFRPDGSGSYYEACREEVDEFPTNPNGGTFVSLWDDDYAGFLLGGGKNILFYGTWYNHFYIGSNGYITFGDGDMEFEPSLENHFDMPRISALFTDLAPPNDECISYKNLSDRLAVTFEDVPLYGDKNSKNSFQVEMFYVDGTIRITWLKLAPAACVVGLSEGYGLPPLLLESDLSEYLPCWPECDLNRDYYVNFKDFAILAEQWLEEDCTIPYWCGKADMDLSSTVDYDDLSICAANWLTADEWWLLPLSHWKFDEGSGTIAYDSAGDNDGTLIGDPCWVAGKIGSYALDFDGSGDYVSVGNTVIHNLPKGTFTAWVNPADLSSNCGGYNFAYIMGANNNTGGELGFRVNGDGSGWASVQNTVPGGALAFPAGSVAVGSWHFVSMTWDGSYWKVYINGVEKDSKSFSQGTSSATNTALIGKGWDGCTWNGKIDDVRIYDRALSGGEILQLYYEGVGPKAFNPNPADRAAGVDPNTLLSWSPGKDAASHDVYLGIDFDDVNDADIGSPEYMGNFDVNSWDPCGLGLDTTYYWRIDEKKPSGAAKGDIWSFTTWVMPNLVGWWKFDEGGGTTAYDSAGFNDGTLVNGPVWTTGQINGALSFDGVDDYVGVSAASAFDFERTDTFTLSVWYKGSSSSSTILSKMDYALDYRGYDIFLNSGYVEAHLVSTWSNNAICVDGTLYPVTDSLWHYIVVTYDGSNSASGLKIYVDGMEETTSVYRDSLSSTIRNSVSFKVAARSNGAGALHYLDGLADDVRVYNRVLSAEEIEELYREGSGPKAFNPNPANGAAGMDPNTVLSWSPGKDAASHDVYLGINFDDVNDADIGSPEYMGNFDVNAFDPCGLDINTTCYWRIDEVNGLNVYKGDIWSFTTWVELDPNLGLVSLWKFDEGSGTVAYDSAGDNDGTLIGDPCWVAGEIGSYALDFDGSGDYVSVGNTVTHNLPNGTFTAWVYPYSLSSTCGGYNFAYIMGANSYSGGELGFRVNGDGSGWASVRNTVTNGHVDFPAGSITIGSWYFVAMTWDGSYWKLYINGVQKDSKSFSQGTSSATNTALIGKGWDGCTWNGTIDDVRIYSRALSAGEILQLYLQGL